MLDSDALPLVRRLIVGSRGRERADRLICYGEDAAEHVIQVKDKTRAARYVALVSSCAPVCVEAYAGKTLVDAWGERPRRNAAAAAAAADVGAALVEARVVGARGATRKAPRGWRGTLMALATHHASLLSTAYTGHSAQLSSAHKTQAERDEKIFAHIVQIAQHHSDRAAHAEARALEAEKGVRLRDKQILELHQHLLRMQAKIGEIAASADGGDKRTDAFMKLLEVAKMGSTMVTGENANGKASSKTKGAAA